MEAAEISVCPRAGVFQSIAARWKHFIDPDQRIGIWRDSEVFGYEHQPNSKGRHHGREFDVWYSIDANGCRYSPDVRKLDSTVDVSFLGCSWTFGHGVADGESFPAVIARTTGLMCENHGVMGWGTAHALLKLREIIHRDRLPKKVIYSLLPDHITRNASRKSWVRGIAKYGRRHPHFMIANGELCNHGLCCDVDIIPDSESDLHQLELELTGSMITEMGNACRKADIEFFVVILKGHLPFPICRTLISAATKTIDLTHIKIQAFRGDHHPNPDDHCRLAAAMLQEDSIF